MSRISYSGVVLDDKSREKLINYFKEEIPVDWKIIAHHMTINLGPIDSSLERYLGLNVRLKVVDYAIDEYVIAAGVIGFESKNEKPHITLAINSKLNAKPKQSNDLVSWKRIKRPLYLTGVVKEIPLKF